jgi:hypothetical protein
VICNTTYSEYNAIYYRRKIDRFEGILEILEQAHRKESILKRINELKKQLTQLERDRKDGKSQKSN